MACCMGKRGQTVPLSAQTDEETASTFGSRIPLLLQRKLSFFSSLFGDLDFGSVEGWPPGYLINRSMDIEKASQVKLGAMLGDSGFLREIYVPYPE